MNEFCSTEEIIENIKDIISNHITQKKVFDWHVADALGVHEQNLAAMKKRNKLPLKEVILFCDRCGLDPMKIVMKKKELLECIEN